MRDTDRMLLSEIADLGNARVFHKVQALAEEAAKLRDEAAQLTVLDELKEALHAPEASTYRSIVEVAHMRMDTIRVLTRAAHDARVAFIDQVYLAALQACLQGTAEATDLAADGHIVTPKGHDELFRLAREAAKARDRSLRSEDE